MNDDLAKQLVTAVESLTVAFESRWAREDDRSAKMTADSENDEIRALRTQLTMLKIRYQELQGSVSGYQAKVESAQAAASERTTT